MACKVVDVKNQIDVPVSGVHRRDIRPGFVHVD